MKSLVIVILIAAAAGGGYWFYRARQTAAERPSYVPVTIEKRIMVDAIEAPGVVEPRNRLEMKPPIGGRVESILVEEGHLVKRGEIVAWLSATERAALLDAARAQGEAELKRWEDIYRPTPMVAPLDGTIIARNAEPGQTVTGQDVLLVLSDYLIVRAQVDETDIGQVVEGLKSVIQLDAYPDVAVTGAVRHIAFEALTVNNVTIYEVQVELDTIPACMKSGMTVSARFILQTVPEAVTVSADALVREGGRTFVWVDDGVAATPPTARDVKTGIRDDGRVEIREGLTGDEQLVRQVFAMPDKKASGSPLIPRRR